jgi:hypothetical protein
MQVTRRQQEDPGSTAFVSQGVDRRRAPTARASDRFGEGPPFPPVAERCAFT